MIEEASFWENIAFLQKNIAPMAMIVKRNRRLNIGPEVIEWLHNSPSATPS